MEEPPDPGDPVPPAACFVTIETNNNCAMDTEIPVVKNKKKRKINEVPDGSSDSIKAPVSSPKPAPAPVVRSLYVSTDNGPYTVHVIRENNTQNDGTTLHPITFGRFLHKHKISNVVNGSLKRIGRNKITLSFLTFKDANMFITNQFLATEKLKAFIPTFTITRMGLVRGIPSEWSEEEVLESINVSIGCGKVLKVRRLNYKVVINGAPVWKPSQSVVLTFDGKFLPNHVYVCYNSVQVELYTFPTIMCYNCCHFGHTKNQCRSKPRCYKCGQDHSGDSCKTEEDTATCCHCSGSHFASNKVCPEFVRQKKIKLSMAEQCISYAEAAKLHAPIGKSYSEVLSSSPPISKIERPIMFTTPAPRPSAAGPSRGGFVVRTSKSGSPVRTNTQAKGYDRRAHRELVKEYDMLSGSGNGCGLIKANSNDQLSIETLKQIMSTLIDTLRKNNIMLPNNVAPLIEQLNNNMNVDNTFRYSPAGQSTHDCSVELPKCRT